jgi:tRNA-dihydrouridine synthase B
MWKNIPKPIFCLAPMAGITDSAFRLICKEEGADIVYSEMASAAALFFKPQKTLELIKFSLEEQPYVVQLFGKDPEHFEKATRIISQGIPLIDYKDKKTVRKNKIHPPNGIDINFGCPAKKVFGHGSGAALMQNPQLAREIIEAVANNTKLPLSLKIRSGLENSQGSFPLLDFLQKIKVNTLGISAIMIHGRDYKQGFKGAIDYKTIREVKKYFRGVVIANGGIKTVNHAKIMLKKTGADGIGVARGVYGNPFLFRKLMPIKKDFPKEKSLQSKKEPGELIWRHGCYAYKLKGEKGLVELRKHLLWYFKGLPNLKKIRPKIIKLSSLGGLKTIIKDVEKLSKN